MTIMPHCTLASLQIACRATTARSQRSPWRRRLVYASVFFTGLSGTAQTAYMSPVGTRHTPLPEGEVEGGAESTSAETALSEQMSTAFAGLLGQMTGVMQAAAANAVASLAETGGTLAGSRGPQPKPLPAPEFNDRLEAWRDFELDAEAWLAQYPSLTEEQKAQEVGMRMLRGPHSRAIYHGLLRTHSSHLTYSQLMKQLRESFSYVLETEDAFATLRTLTQGQRSVVAYYTHLMRLLDTPGLEAIRRDAKSCMLYFRSGLTEPIQDKLLGQTFPNLSALYAAAVAVDQQLSKNRPLGPAAGASQDASDAVDAVPVPSLSSMREGSGRPHGKGHGHEGGQGNRSSDPRQRQPTSQKGGGLTSPWMTECAVSRADVVCYRSGGKGHYARECPSDAPED